MQLVGEVMGQVSDALHNSGINGFDETKLSNDWGRILLEAAGSAAVAGVTGGNVGAATGSAIAGDIVTASTVNTIKDWAIAQSNGNPDTAKLLTNAIENAFASMGGAAAGGAIGGGTGAINGAGISSSIQEYNMAAVDDAIGAAALAGVAIWAVANNKDVGQALSDVISYAGNVTSNVYGYFLDSSVNNQAQGVGQALMGMAVMAQAAPELYNQLTQYASQSAEQYGQYIDLMKQVGATIYGSITIDPNAGKGTTLTTPITENNGTTLTTPITDRDKNSGTIADPIPDENKGWTEGFTADPDAGKGTIFTSTGNPPPNLSPDGAGRNGALREAKRYVGIPVTQQPESIGPNINKQGKVVGGMDYVYTPTGQDSKFIAEDGKIHIRDDADGHMYIDDPTQDRGSHFNTEDGAHFDYKK
ncbi:HNH/endonuclease VII fold putative polymorphic toxin [Commensalibacter nepenthis]|uniref:HNH/endonuclease VII fold putative polymorphic toxin n=1 Tax=Commensalibacter nepenthis TaxID=3043872 RepID=A0ABT6QA45_9PROT|nr:HNH/endonuclease VII fold putative polymorphic toxin [Commensalibacter sp. TBRC 10068]MDI2113780.1 HNH/endonuclease VII fold putative polymorphic toxin [Commensalibacter sp. TBRC 10068]